MVERKLISYVAMSLDGFIAKPDGDISFLSIVEKEGEDYGYAEFIKTIDTIIVGRKTYDKILDIGFNYPLDKDIYVISRNIKKDQGRIKTYSGSLRYLVSDLRKTSGRNIFCDGGSEIVNELLQDNLIDEFIISIIPVVLGEGILFFKEKRPELKLELINCQKFDTGLVQLHYVRNV